MHRERSSGAEAALDVGLDPVSAGKEYRDTLLGLLGDQDPTEVIQRVPDDAETLVHQAGEHLRTRPEPSEWSVIELLGHMVDAELMVAGRLRWILAHEEPPLMAYDQDLLVERLRHVDEDPNELLALWRALIRSHVRLWNRTSEGDRARVGIHAERGPESFDITYRMLAGHGLLHIAQMRRTLEQIGHSAGASPS
ncbi:MAG TPA: DinB family protein [Actinomycetota bacterium]|nr:DinB family protein [Actinomycetota bacterium]